MTFPVLPSGTSGCYVPTGKKLTNSLRFRSSASAYLNRTFGASPTSATTQTYSVWVKRGLLSSSTDFNLFAGYDGASNSPFAVIFRNDTFYVQTGGVASYGVASSAVYRDPSAWYHLVVAIDTTQATSTNRVKLYVNGSQITSFSSSNYPPQNQQIFYLMTNSNNQIGTAFNASYFYDGYMAEVNVIDGQALSPTSFGQFDPVTGVWVPVNYTGTYGTNGFYLPFTDTTSATTLAYDQSGNGNNWTPNNISTTAGSTYDAMTDVPTLTNTNDANYAVMNPLSGSTPGTNTLSNGNLTATGVNGVFVVSNNSTISMINTKSYMEVTETVVSSGSANTLFGITDGSGSYVIRLSDPGALVVNGSSVGTYTASAGDVFGIAVDAINGTVTVLRNNVALITNYAFTYTGNLYFSTTMSSAIPTIGSVSINFGQQPFQYTPPAGFLPLNTFNLPCPTIWNGANVMAATLYTGNGSTQTISNAANNTIGKTFYPDLTWIKDRTSALDNELVDSVRGATIQTQSNTQNPNSTNANGLTSFGATGFSIGNSANYNTNTDAFVAWQWNAGNGATSSNTNGSLTSTVSVNPTAGFSVVTYTGNNTGGATFGHGLGVAPSMVITKPTNTLSDWGVYHTSIGPTAFLRLNSTAASQTASTIWNNTSPTSTVVTLGTATLTNDSAGMVAYCWAAIPGYSAFGSYTGNGSTTPTTTPFIYTGFRPRFVLVKSTSVGGVDWNWTLVDSSRSSYNTQAAELFPNLNIAENSGTNAAINFYSNGFSPNGNDRGTNESGTSYIYAAFAENPFKYANAR